MTRTQTNTTITDIATRDVALDIGRHEAATIAGGDALGRPRATRRAGTGGLSSFVLRGRLVDLPDESPGRQRKGLADSARRRCATIVAAEIYF